MSAHRPTLVFLWILCAACRAPVKQPAPVVKKQPQRKPDPLERYWRTQAAMLGMNSLMVLRDNVRDIWNEPRDEGVSISANASFPPGGSGWFPARSCCSYPDRRCPAVAGVPPAPWVELRFIHVKPARHWQYRYSSAGVGPGATFVADARGDPGCTGGLLWFRIKGRIADDLAFVREEPDVVKGEDPRTAALASLGVLERALTGPREDLHGVAVYHLMKHGRKARPLALRLLKSEVPRLRRDGATLLKLLGPNVAPVPDAGVAPAVAPRTASAGPSAAPLGLPACDDFLRKYERCAFTRAPPASHKAFKHSIATMRSSYRKALRASGTRRKVEQSCRRAAAAIKRAMRSFNCQW